MFLSSKQYPEGTRQKSGAKGKGKRKKKIKKISCNSREERRHERIYRNGDIVGRSSSHHSKKGKSREVALGVEVALCNERKEQQPPRPLPWEIPFLEFKMIREIPSSAVNSWEVLGVFWGGGGWISPADSNPHVFGSGVKAELVGGSNPGQGRGW